MGFTGVFIARTCFPDGIVKCNDTIRNKPSKQSLCRNNSNANLNFPSVIGDKSHSDSVTFNLMPKGLNFGHLNIQGICGKNMCMFSEIKAILTAPENRSLHIFGISETKLKSHKLSSCFKIDGFQEPFRKDNDGNGGGGILVYVRNGINAMRRFDLETNNKACIWLEIRVKVNHF